MVKYAIVLASAAFIIWPAMAFAEHSGCIGAAIGDGCIGIPTPRERHDEGRWRDRDQDRPVIIKKHRHRHHEGDEE